MSLKYEHECESTVQAAITSKHLLCQVHVYINQSNGLCIRYNYLWVLATFERQTHLRRKCDWLIIFFYIFISLKTHCFSFWKKKRFLSSLFKEGTQLWLISLGRVMHSGSNNIYILTQSLCGNRCTWAHCVRQHIATCIHIFRKPLSLCVITIRTILRKDTWKGNLCQTMSLIWTKKFCHKKRLLC